MYWNTIAKYYRSNVELRSFTMPACMLALFPLKLYQVNGHRLQLPMPAQPTADHSRATVILCPSLLSLTTPAPNSIGWYSEVSCVHWVTGNK